MHFKVMSQHVIVISSFQTAAELFEKRGDDDDMLGHNLKMHDVAYF